MAAAEETFETVLARLESERVKLNGKLSKIDAAISAIKELAGITTTESEEATSGVAQIKPYAFRGKGVAKATRQYLRMVNKKQTTRQIMDALQQGGIGKKLKSNVVYGTLRREQIVKGDIIRTDNYWALAEWNNQ